MQTLLRYGFVIAVLVIVLGFALEFLKTQSNAELVKGEVQNLVERADKVLGNIEEGPAAEPFRTRVISEKDREKAADLIRDAERVLKKADLGTDPDDYYQLGIVLLNLGKFDHAAASFLAAVDARPDWGEAYLRLATTYQLQANGYTRNENFGLAEKALDKANRYVKTALQYDTADSAVHVQLGYVYKELAQRYAATGRQNKVKGSLDKASAHFNMALGVDKNNAGAHNGLASVYIVRGDYEKAIDKTKKEIELSPKYLFAHYDLAMAYYGKAGVSTTEKERLTAMRGFLKAYQSILDLDGKPSAGNLPATARQDLARMEKIIIAEVNRISPEGQTATQESQLEDSNKGRSNASQNLITYVVYFASTQARLARELADRLLESGFESVLSSSAELPSELQSGVVPLGNSMSYHVSVPEAKVNEVRRLVGGVITEAKLTVYDAGFIPLASGYQWRTDNNELLIVLN